MWEVLSRTMSGPASDPASHPARYMTPYEEWVGGEDTAPSVELMRQVVVTDNQRPIVPNFDGTLFFKISHRVLAF